MRDTMKKSDFIKQNWGKCPFCNKKPERAPHIGNFCFPLCYRCIFIIIGLFLNLFLTTNKAYVHAHEWICIFIGLILTFPCWIDGIRQNRFGHLSTNPRRVILGFIAGMGIGLFINAAVSLVFELIYS